jgi:hypothetical protein
MRRAALHGGLLSNIRIRFRPCIDDIAAHDG